MKICKGRKIRCIEFDVFECYYEIDRKFLFTEDGIRMSLHFSASKRKEILRSYKYLKIFVNHGKDCI